MRLDICVTHSIRATTEPLHIAGFAQKGPNKDRLWGVETCLLHSGWISSINHLHCNSHRRLGVGSGRMAPGAAPPGCAVSWTCP